jgi:mono/diheme cytochrome c family protein
MLASVEVRMARVDSRVLGLALSAAALVCLVATSVPAQSRIEYVPAKRISSIQGADVYEAYCATCHGPAAQGNGRAASLLRVRPPDLTLIVVRDGRFDRMHVMNHCGVVGQNADSPMPSWDSILADTYGERKYAQLAIHNVAVYVETLQRD